MVEATAEDERVVFATERDVTVEEARRGIVTRSSVPRPLLSPTIDDASSNLAGARRFRPLPLLILKSVGTTVNYYAHLPLYFWIRVGSISTALAKEKASDSKT